METVLWAAAGFIVGYAVAILKLGATLLKHDRRHNNAAKEPREWLELPPPPPRPHSKPKLTVVK